MAKLYTKRVWKNDVTKLSAKNLNHIEDGLELLAEVVEGMNDGGHIDVETHEHANKAILDQTTAAFTTELKNQYDSYAEKSAVSASSEGTATNKIKYITINGVEYQLAGQEEIQYSELNNVSLNEVTDTGIYAITDAVNIPEATSADGVLTVTKLSDTLAEQEWKSKVNSAYRILTIGAVGTENIFKVNGRTVEQGTVQLEANGTYELSGNLVGHIVIGHGEAKDTLNNRTVLILKGVNILSDADVAIDYTPEDKKLAIYLDNNSENYIFVNLAGATSQGEKGAINSENGLSINGVGYLTVKNTKGHGFKASELYVDGNPHIYVDCNHDAFHGKNLVKITNGYFYIADCNDAFSAGHDDPADDGRLLIYGGEFNIIKTKEAAFDGRSSDAKKRILNATIHFGPQVTETVSNHGATNPIKFYQGLNTITGKTVTEVDMGADFSQATQTYSDTAKVIYDGEVIEPISGEFRLTQAGQYKLIGDFSNYRVISDPPANSKIDILFGDVYYNNELETDPFILHTSTTKRIKFDSSVEDVLLYVKKASGYIIQSNRGIQLSGKGDYILDGCGTALCGIYAPKSYILMDNDGVKNITGCITGVYADNLRLGKDPDDVASGKYGASDGSIYILGNETDAKMTNQGDYENYRGKILASQYHLGASIIGNVEADADATVVIRAEDDLVNPKDPGPDAYQNAAVLYIGTSVGSRTNVKSYTAPVGIKSTIPDITIEEGATSPWTVYAGNGYSKDEVDAGFVPVSAFNILKAELKSVSPKKVNIINYAEDDTKTDHRPAKDHAYAEGKIDSIEIFRYACPERIDIDDTPETHLSYFKDGRQIYARDGDFGYPEIDGTGQFNFRPIFSSGYTSGYVVVPTVTTLDETSADTAYNKFKTPWCTGIDGLYRFTKISKDINISLSAVDESTLETNTITYKIEAPLDYEGALPIVKVFRCADQVEKYMKYGSGAATPVAYSTLDNSLMTPVTLTFTETTAAENPDHKEFTFEGISYDDTTGYPSAVDAKANFIVDSSNVDSNYSVTTAAKKIKTDGVDNYNKLSDSEDYPTSGIKTLTKINGNVTVTIKIAPPVSLTYGLTRSSVTLDAGPASGSSIASNASFTFTIKHSLGLAENTTPKLSELQASNYNHEFAYNFISSITVGGSPVEKNTFFETITYSKQKINYTVDGEKVTGDIVITFTPASTISFNANGGSGEMASVSNVKTGSLYTLPVCTFTAPAGKEFEGWKINNVDYAVGDTVPAFGNIELIAVWSPLRIIFENGNEADNNELTSAWMVQKYANSGWTDQTNAYVALDESNSGYTDSKCVKMHYWKNDTHFRYGKATNITQAIDTVKLALKGDGAGTVKIRFNVTQPNVVVGNIPLTGAYMTYSLNAAGTDWTQHIIDIDDNNWVISLGGTDLTPPTVRAQFNLTSLAGMMPYFDTLWILVRANVAGGPESNIYVDNIEFTADGAQTSSAVIPSSAE